MLQVDQTVVPLQFTGLQLFPKVPYSPTILIEQPTTVKSLLHVIPPISISPAEFSNINSQDFGLFLCQR